MRNFFNNFDDIKNGLSLKIKDNKLLIIIFSIIFIAGLFLGIFIEKSSAVKIYYIEYTENYYYSVFSQSESAFSILFIRIGNNILFFSITILLSLSIYLVPLHFIIIFYRGFILGVVCVIIFSSYSINGIFLTVLVVIPQNIISTFFLILAIISSMENSQIFKRQRCYFGFKSFLLNILLLYAFSLLGAVLELIIISCIMRPLNFLF